MGPRRSWASPREQDTRAYAGDDPVNEADPSGMWTAGDCAQAGFAILTSVGLNGCIIGMMKGTHRIGDAGVAFSPSGAIGANIGAYAGLALDVSDASSWNLFRGPFEYAEIGGDVLFGAGVIVYWSPNFDITDPTKAGTVIGGEFGVSVGADVDIASYGVLRTFVLFPPWPLSDGVDWTWDTFGLNQLFVAEHWLTTDAPKEIQKARQKNGEAAC